MTKKQRKQRLKSVKKAAEMFGTAAALAIPVALAVPGFASASPEIIPQPDNLPVVIKSINSALANEHASKLKAGTTFQIDLSTIFEAASTLEYTVVVQNSSVADVKITNNNTLNINLKKIGSTMVDLIVHKPNESMSIHERFTLKAVANGALDPDQDGAGIADIIKYFNSHAGELQTTGDYRTLLQAAVSSTVPTPNHAPLVSPETTSIVMTAGTYTEIHLNDLFSDEDGDELSFELIDPPSSTSFVNAHLYSETSTLVLYATNASLQPLIVTVDGSDGEESATKLFSVTVGAAPVENHAPVANELSVVVLNEDTTASIQLGGTDVDDDELTAIIVEGKGPSHGQLIPSSSEQNRFTYVPDEDYNGPDSFTYIVNDGTVDSEEVTVNITVNPVNDAPVANELSVVELDEDTTASIQLGGTDADEDELTAIIVEGKGPAHGELIPSSSEQNKFTYVPYENYNGPDSFTYVVNDGTEDSEEVTVNITVKAVNHAPEANELSVVELDEDTTASIQLGGTDADEDELTAIIVEGKGPAHGELIPSSSEQNKFTYVPDENYNGPDSFTYIVNDGTEDSEEVTVNITVNPVNDAPVAQDISFEVNEGASKEVNFNGWDVDSGETLQYIIVDEPEYGMVTPDSPNSGQFSYVQNNGTSESDSFTYKIYDGQAYSDVKTVAITIIDVNYAPVANELSVVELDEDTTTSIQLGGTDEDEDWLTAIIVEGKGPIHGELIASSSEQNKFTYVPDENYNGPDSFTYIVNDGKVDSEEVTVTVNITPIDDIPVAGMVGQEGYIQLHRNQSAMLELSKVFTEVDGQQLTYRTNFQGNGYSLTGTFDGSNLFLNALGSFSTISFDVQASDDNFATWVSIPLEVEVNDGEFGSLPDQYEISNLQNEYTVDLADYFEGNYGHYFSYITEPPFSGLQIVGSTLTVPLEDDHNVNVVVSAWDDHGLTITDNFNLYVGVGLKDIGVQFFNNVEYYTDHNAHVYMKDIFQNADEFRVTAYNDEEVMSIGSYELGEWTSEDYLSLWTDATFTNVSEITVEGRTLNGQIVTNERSYTLRIRENSAPYVDHDNEMPTPLKKGETVELVVTDAEGDPITSVVALPDDSICGESGICITTNYENGILFVTGVETGTRSLRISTSDGLPFGDDSVYRYFTVYDDSIDIVDDFSIDKDLAGLLTGMNLGSLTLLGVESEYMIHDPGATLNGTTLHFDVNSEVMYPGASEFITVTITDGSITRVLTLYMNVAWVEPGPGSA
ncbi:Cadherin-like [Paenibacillus sp. CF384]|nr:Ig-like domain-containing protein [Paenibacillus sp. CF384]SDX75512.1 Cadherin-like [Paenibacillus sp. CF384]